MIKPFFSLRLAKNTSADTCSCRVESLAIGQPKRKVKKWKESSLRNSNTRNRSERSQRERGKPQKILIRRCTPSKQGAQFWSKKERRGERGKAAQITKVIEQYVLSQLNTIKIVS